MADAVGRTTTAARRLMITAMLIVIALAIAACAPEEVEETVEADPADPEEAVEEVDPDDGPSFDLTGMQIRFGTSAPSALFMGPPRVADLLEEWGADVELETLTRVTGIEALVARRLDVFGRSADEPVVGRSRGEDVIALGSPYTAQPYVLAGVPDINSVADLEGRTLGISSPAGADALLFRFIMGQEGMDHTRDVSFVQIGGSPDRVQALLAGELDAAIIFMDGMVQIEQQTDEIHNVGFMSEFIPEPGWQAALYSGYREFFEQNSELSLAIACANLETNRWINDNEDEYVQYTLDNVPGATEEAVREFYVMATEVNMWPTTADTLVNMPAMDNYIAGMVEGGELDEHIPADEVVDTSYLEEAEAMGCGAG